MRGNPLRPKQSGLHRFSSFAAGHRILAVAAAGCALTLLGGGIATASTFALGAHEVGNQYNDGLQLSTE